MLEEHGQIFLVQEAQSIESIEYLILSVVSGRLNDIKSTNGKIRHGENLTDFTPFLGSKKISRTRLSFKGISKLVNEKKTLRTLERNENWQFFIQTFSLDKPGGI